LGRGGRKTRGKKCARWARKKNKWKGTWGGVRKERKGKRRRPMEGKTKKSEGRAKASGRSQFYERRRNFTKKRRWPNVGTAPQNYEKGLGPGGF